MNWRNPKIRQSGALALLMVSLAPATVFAMEAWEHTWIEVRTAHFAIISAVQQKRTIELARELESFRAALEVVMNTGPVADRVPTTLYLLPSGVKGVGYFFHNHYPTMRANYVAVINSEVDLELMAKHEVVHILNRNSAPFGFPAWFDEGLAEVFGTATVDGNVVEYGKPMFGNRFWGWMSIDALLETRDFSKPAPFMNWPWALMRYLMDGRPDRKFDADSAQFFDMIQDGATQTDALEHAFDVKILPLGTVLSRYVGGRLKYYRASFADVPTAPSVVRAPPDWVAAQLGKLLFIQGMADAAEHYWNAAITLNPDNADALAGLGDVRRSAAQFDEAEPYYKKAIALEPQNAYHELDYGEFFLARGRAATDSAKISSDLTEARLHFTRSVALDPNIPETFAMNGSSYLFLGESIDKALEALTTAHTMLPTDPTINVQLAKAFLQSGERTKAERLLRLLVLQSESAAVREAEKLLQGLTAETTAEAAPADH